MSAKQKGKTPSQPTVKPAAATRAATPAVRTHFLQPGFRRQHGLTALLLVVVAFVLYGQAIRFGYVLDDELVLWNNLFVQKGLGGLPEIFANDSFLGYFRDPQKLFLLEGGRYRPLSLATFALEVELFGAPGPGLAHISHFINILLYGLTGALLYRLFLAFFPLRESGHWWASAAFWGAALFVLHPVHSEAVANIKGRDEIMALLGSLGALYFTLKYFDTRRNGWLAGAGLSFFLGLLSKENALTFLAVIPLTVWFFGRVPVGQALRAAIPLAIAALVFIGLKYAAQGYLLDHGRAMNDLMNDPFLGMTTGERTATIFLTLGWYLKLLFVPHPLTHDYYPYHVPRVGWSDWRALLSLAIYAGMALWALWRISRRDVPAYAIAFFLLTISIVSNLFVSVGTFMNERFVYMPSVAFCLLAGWWLAQKLPEWLGAPAGRPAILGVGLFALLAAGFAWTTLRRVPDWQSKLALNTAAVRVSPNSARAQCYYAVALFEEAYKELKDPAAKAAMVDTMDAHLQRALAINPKYGAAWQMVPGVAAERFEMQQMLKKQTGKGPEMDRLLNDFRYVLKNAPNNANAVNYIIQYVEYLASRGGNPNKILTFCYAEGYEHYFRELRNPALAIRIMEAGLKTQYEDARLFSALAEVYRSTGNAAKAAELEQRAVAAQSLYSQEE